MTDEQNICTGINPISESLRVFPEPTVKSQEPRRRQLLVGLYEQKKERGWEMQDKRKEKRESSRLWGVACVALEEEWGQRGGAN